MSSKSASTKALNKILADNLNGDESSTFKDLVDAEHVKAREKIDTIKNHGKANQKPQPSHELPPKQVEETQETLCQEQVQLQAQAKHAGTQGLAPSSKPITLNPFMDSHRPNRGKFRANMFKLVIFSLTPTGVMVGVHLYMQPKSTTIPLDTIKRCSTLCLQARSILRCM